MKTKEDIARYLTAQGSAFSLLAGQSEKIFEIGQKMIEWWQEGRIFLGCGNGGSAAEVSHAVGEATIRLRGDDSRPPFLFFNLAADSSILTAGANDLGYDEVFAHQVKACSWHMKRDGAKFVLIGVSTSGTSKNVMRAIDEAKKHGIPTVGMTWGSPYKEICQLADYSIAVPLTGSNLNPTQANQTINLAIWHIWFEMMAAKWEERSEGQKSQEIFVGKETAMPNNTTGNGFADRLLEILRGFSGKRILECGDVMLDYSQYGDVERICPEAPVPVVRETRSVFTPGGSANVAKNLCSLGAETFLAGVIGDDGSVEGEIPWNQIMRKTLEQEGIHWIGFTEPGRPTTVKQRVLARTAHTGYQLLLRIDKDTTKPYQIIEPSRLFGRYDACHVGDYNKGFFTEGLAASLRQFAAERRIPLVIDPKPAKGRNYDGLYSHSVVTPNEKELGEMVDMVVEADDDQQVAEAGMSLARRLNSVVIVTRGRFGCTVCQADGKTDHIKTLEVPLPAVEGAGDTLGAGLTLSLCSGANLIEAAHLATVASWLVVQKPGTASVTVHEIEAEIERRVAKKIYPFDQS